MAGLCKHSKSPSTKARLGGSLDTLCHVEWHHVESKLTLKKGTTLHVTHKSIEMVRCATK